MKKIIRIAAISLFTTFAIVISSSTFAQSAKMKTLMYYVNVHLTREQSSVQLYRIEIWDQYGWRVLAPKSSIPGQHIYVFQETVPESVPGFVRIARFVYIPSYSPSGHLLTKDPKVKPDAEYISSAGNYYFDLYPWEASSRNSPVRTVIKNDL